MSKWIEYIELDVKDSFETKDELKDSKLISEIGIITITRIQIKFDKRKTTRGEIIFLTKGKEV
ncbi:MAG: hypothetical protein ABIP51_10080 [Bacteroidia bacterium]